MTGTDDDPFTRALRDDLPEAADEARVRLRLASAGVLAGAVAAPIGTAAAAAGVTAKVVAFPLAVKVGASLAVVGLVTAPVLSHFTSRPVANRPNMTTTTAARPSPSEKTTPQPASEPAPVPLAAPANHSALARETAPAVRENARPALRESTTVSLPVTTKPLPSVASFEDVALPKPIDEGSLRAETALIERALSALKRDDVATARAALLEHARKFPNGHLVRERERALERTLAKETEPHAH